MCWLEGMDSIELEARMYVLEVAGVLRKKEAELVRYRFDKDLEALIRSRWADGWLDVEKRIEKNCSEAYQQVARECLRGTPEGTYLQMLKREYGLMRQEAEQNLSSIRIGLEVYDLPIGELGMEKRTRNILTRQMRYCGELVERHPLDLVKLKGLSWHSVKDVQVVLLGRGLSLGMKIGYVPPERRPVLG